PRAGGRAVLRTRGLGAARRCPLAQDARYSARNAADPARSADRGGPAAATGGRAGLQRVLVRTRRDDAPGRAFSAREPGVRARSRERPAARPGGGRKRLHERATPHTWLRRRVRRTLPEDMSDDANRRHDGPVLPCETEPVSEYEALFEPPPAAVPRRRGWWPFKPSRREAAKAADVAHRAAMPEVTGAEAPPVVAPPASGPEAAPEVVASAVEVAAPPDSESLPAPAPEVVASAVEIAAPPDSESLPAPAPEVVASAVEIAAPPDSES